MWVSFVTGFMDLRLFSHFWIILLHILCNSMPSAINYVVVIVCLLFLLSLIDRTCTRPSAAFQAQILARGRSPSETPSLRFPSFAMRDGWWALTSWIVVIYKQRTFSISTLKPFRNYTHRISCGRVAVPLYYQSCNCHVFDERSWAAPADLNSSSIVNVWAMP